MKKCVSCGHHFEKSDWQCPNCSYAPVFAGSHVLFAPNLENNQGFDERHFSKLYTIEPGNYWFEARRQLILSAIQRYFPQANKFIEIGCGTGFLLSSLETTFPHLSLAGSDIYSAGLDYTAKRCKKANLYQNDARNLPFKNEFDLIGLFDVLEHIEEDAAVLAQAYSVLKTKGGMLLTVPQHKFLWSKTDDDACHVRRYNRKELKAKVEDAGFKVLRITSFVTFLFPLMILSRSINAVKPERDFIDELKVPILLNSVLTKCLDLERMFIKAGINFPFGGSLLLIARKV